MGCNVVDKWAALMYTSGLNSISLVNCIFYINEMYYMLFGFVFLCWVFPCFFYTFLGFDGGLHEGCTSLFESQGSEVAMEDCAIEISPDNSGSLARDGLNTNVASGPDGGSVSRPSSPHNVYDVDDDDFVTPVNQAHCMR